MERAAVAIPERTGPHSEVKRFSSGSTLLNLALGGGYGVGRMANIVGDRSTCKTLLAIEAFANFKLTFPSGPMRYAEAEAAFDDSYAVTMGMPTNVERPEDLIDTAQAYGLDLDKFCHAPVKTPNAKTSALASGPRLYILDSLDALSDDAEMALKPGETNTFGVGKAKELSRIYRKQIRDMEAAECAHIVISQVRENIGVMFGAKYTRAGGKALDFYCSHVIWLAEVAKLKRTLRGEERAVGITVKANVKKNKLGMPFRTVEFDVVFGYGIDDEISMLNWLKDVKAISDTDIKDFKGQLESFRARQDRVALAGVATELKKMTTEIWMEIEESLAPVMSKY